MRTNLIRFITLLLVLPFSGVAMAHTGLEGAGFMSGVLHPLTGLDHLLVIFAIGLWAAKGTGLKSKSPLMAFAAFMIIGGLMASSGIALAGMETMIAMSVLVMGLFLVSKVNVQSITVAMVAFFALFHGQAHMLEMTALASPLVYGLGFIMSTVALLTAGVALGQWIYRKQTEWVLRVTGAITGSIGALSLLGAN